MPESDLQTRIDQALLIAYRLGTIDGGNHKMWVIDQMVRALLGAPTHPAAQPERPTTAAMGTAMESYRQASEAHSGYRVFCAGDWDEGVIP